MRKRTMYLTVEEVATLLGVSVSHAYRMVEEMNADLESRNYFTIVGRVPIRYLEDRIYKLEHAERYLDEVEGTEW